MEERTYGPLLHAKFDLDRCSVSPLRGEKPQNRPVSKRNTGRAALRADPAGKKTQRRRYGKANITGLVKTTQIMHNWKSGRLQNTIAYFQLPCAY